MSQLHQEEQTLAHLREYKSTCFFFQGAARLYLTQSLGRTFLFLRLCNNHCMTEQSYEVGVVNVTT